MTNMLLPHYSHHIILQKRSIQNLYYTKKLLYLAISIITSWFQTLHNTSDLIAPLVICLYIFSGLCFFSVYVIFLPFLITVSTFCSYVSPSFSNSLFFLFFLLFRFTIINFTHFISNDLLGEQCCLHLAICLHSLKFFS